VQLQATDEFDLTLATTNKSPMTNSVEVWAIVGEGPVVKKVPSIERGIFHRGNCYLILWCSDMNARNRRNAKYVHRSVVTEQAYTIIITNQRLMTLGTWCTFGKASTATALDGGQHSSWASIPCCNDVLVQPM
jgi:hypothetical protein